MNALRPFFQQIASDPEHVGSIAASDLRRYLPEALAFSSRNLFIPLIPLEDWTSPNEAAETLPPDVTQWVTLVPGLLEGFAYLFPDESLGEPRFLMYSTVGGQFVRFAADEGKSSWYAESSSTDCGDPIGKTACQRNSCGGCKNFRSVFKGFDLRACRCPHG